MTKNNHISEMRRLSSIMSQQASTCRPGETRHDVYEYARLKADIENAVVVVSDMANATSRIFNGGFAKMLGLEQYSNEGSIWEKQILATMSDDEIKAKIVSELRFYRYVQSHPKTGRNYYMMAHLRMADIRGAIMDVLHRMYYVYEENVVRYAVCTYTPLMFSLPAKSLIINSLTGVSENLSDAGSEEILTRRERQVLMLISRGRKSSEIGELLCISVNTVNRHRQSILDKLNVRKSVEAIDVARIMGLI